MERQPSDGDNAKSKETLSSPDGVIHPRFMKTKFTFSEEDLATIWMTFLLLIWKRKLWRQWKPMFKFPKQEEDTALVLLEAVWLFLEDSTESTLMISIILTFLKQRRKSTPEHQILFLNQTSLNSSVVLNSVMVQSRRTVRNKSQFISHW